MRRIIFITASTYASWLHGDPRWSNDKDKGLIAPCRSLHEIMAANCHSSGLKLTFRQRAGVFDAIVRYCVKKGIKIDALNVREQHFHLLIVVEIDPAEQKDAKVAERIIGNLKGATAYELHKLGVIPSDQPVWSDGAVFTWIYKFDSWYNRQCYTIQRQGSNLYMRDTDFIRKCDPAVPIVNGDFDPNALRRAFTDRATCNERHGMLLHPWKYEGETFWFPSKH